MWCGGITRQWDIVGIQISLLYFVINQEPGGPGTGPDARPVEFRMIQHLDPVTDQYNQECRYWVWIIKRNPEHQDLQAGGKIFPPTPNRAPWCSFWTYAISSFAFKIYWKSILKKPSEGLFMFCNYTVKPRVEKRAFHSKQSRKTYSLFSSEAQSVNSQSVPSSL